MAKNRDSDCGRTYQAPFQATLGGILEQCSENSRGSSSQKLPMCLCLKMDGRTQEYYWSPGGGSIAWRTHDAQYWGVPQRRKRISLVADFRGQSAPEILFEPKGLSGNTEPSEAQREDPAESTGESFDSAEPVCYNGANITSEINHANPMPGDPCHTLTNDSRNYVISFQERSGKPGGGKGILIQKDHVGTLSTLNNQMVLQPNKKEDAE